MSNHTIPLLSGDEDSVRLQRDLFLAETDYLALSDATLTAEMTTYRQALRDITDQAGFPESVTWPTKPQVTHGKNSK